MLTTHSSKGLVWIDMQSPTDQEILSVVQRYGLHPLVGEELKDSPSPAKVDIYPDYVLVILTFPFRMNRGGMYEMVNREIDFVIGKNYIPSPLETEKAYASRHQTLKIQTLDFKLEDFKKTAQVKDDEIQKYYDEKKDTYKTTEKRAVSYVLFENPKDEPAPKADPKDAAKKDAAAEEKKTAEARQAKLKAQVDRVNKFNEASIAANAKFEKRPNPADR